MTRKLKENIILQIYILPFYFFIYMLLFKDSLPDNIISEVEFNKTVKGKSLEQIYEILGEPDLFLVRENSIICDYFDRVYPEKKEIRYAQARLIFYKHRETYLHPRNIYFKK